VKTAAMPITATEIAIRHPAAGEMPAGGSGVGEAGADGDMGGFRVSLPKATDRGDLRGGKEKPPLNPRGGFDRIRRREGLGLGYDEVVEANLRPAHVEGTGFQPNIARGEGRVIR